MISGITGRKILYGCLDWGHGHVYRSIPILRQLIQQNNFLVIFCSDGQQDVFRTYLDDSVIYVRGFESDFSFSGSNNFTLEMWRNRAHFLSGRKKETALVGRLTVEYGIDLIISDHRYGLYNRECESWFLTHQVSLPAGRLANSIHRSLIRPFHKILVLDSAESALAGKLSAGLPQENYLGWYSRFSGTATSVEPNLNVVICSGPEVYALQLMREVVSLEKHFGGIWKCVGSTALAKKFPQYDFVSNTHQADELICRAERIISRSGYTTLMDLEYLHKFAILLPTKGQKEQEYLALLQAGRSDRMILRT